MELLLLVIIIIIISYAVWEVDLNPSNGNNIKIRASKLNYKT